MFIKPFLLTMHYVLHYSIFMKVQISFFRRQSILSDFVMRRRFVCFSTISKVDGGEPYKDSFLSEEDEQIKYFDVHQQQFKTTAGVFRQSESDDVNVLVNNFTAPALARALRDRESTLQQAAMLSETKQYKELTTLLYPFLRENVEKRRLKKHSLDLSTGFTRQQIVIIQRYLHRMPRNVFHAAERRASVVIPLCNVNGVASILFERRSSKVRTYKLQVCFPGGMLEEGVDSTIIQTSLRETEEEIGIPKERIEVLGILRCKWHEVANMAGIAVTPVVGFIGELSEIELCTNSDEVDSVFTVPLAVLLDERMWIHEDAASPGVFTGGPHRIWGLTAYLLERFLRDVIMKCSSNSEPSKVDGQ